MKVSAVSTLRRTLKYVKPYRTWLAVRITGAVVSAAIDIFLAYMVLRLVDYSLAGNKQALINSIYLLAAGIVLAITVSWLNRYSSGHVGIHVGRDMKLELAVRTASFKNSAMESQHSGNILSVLSNDIGMIENFLDSTLPALIFQPLRLIGAIAFLLFINWKLLVFSIIILPGALLIANNLSKPMGKMYEDMQSSLGNMNSVLEDMVGGIYILKSFNLGKTLFGKFKKEVNRVLNKALSIEKRNSMIAPVSVIIQIVPFVLCILYGGWLSVNGQITPGSLLAFMQMMNYIIEPAQIMPGIISNARGSMGGARHFFELLDQEIEEDVGEDFSIKDMPCAVEFKDVTFSYEGEAKVLDGLSFSIPAGKTAAFVGQSGCGKSTLVKLLCGFYNPQQGRISLYGHDLESWSLSAARNKLAVVTQDTFLFPVSLAENISYGKPGATPRDIVQAAIAANAHEFIREMPEEYKTVTGERGVRLSGGQRQRIAIARAVLKNAPVLILDEPTSSLDTQSEAVVQEALERNMKGRTAIVIAHRLTTIRNADMIFVMDGGRIVESGTHSSLMEMGGLYNRLYVRQSINFKTQKAERKECVV
ncbi:MAG: ABC transporter ATP-binding protein [Clostridiales bacterium]|nr:ABC transporter ATP-binding protein [Clostridiales bacterium]